MTKKTEISQLESQIASLKKEIKRSEPLAAQVKVFEQQKKDIISEIGDLTKRSAALDAREAKIRKLEDSLGRRAKQLDKREGVIDEVAEKSAFLFKKSAEKVGLPLS